MRQTINILRTLTISIFACLFMISCEYSYIEPIVVDISDDPVSYSEKIQPALDANCNVCHTSISPVLTIGESFNNLMNGNYIDLDNPEASILYTQASGSHEAVFTTEELAYLLKWIEQGALDN